MEKLRMQLKRFNSALGTAGTLKAQLAADCLTLETKITGTLKVMWHRSSCAGLRSGRVPQLGRSTV